LATKIEWARNADGSAGETWNPTVGCSILTPGCVKCYAMRDAWRKNANPLTPQYHGLTRLVNGKPVWTGEVRLHAPALQLPLRRRKPITWFVDSMSDLFHQDVPDTWIDQVFAVMALCPQHTFQVLTKRSARMRAYMTAPNRKRTIAATVVEISERRAIEGGHRARISLDHFSACFAGAGPFPNVWLGVSAERQAEADERIPDLLATPAAVRFLSAEPLLGPLDLTTIQAPHYCPEDHELDWKFNALETGDYFSFLDSLGVWEGGDGPDRPDRLDWVIAGGESGPDSRPMHPDWARRIRDDCANAEVPFLFKQWGDWTPGVNVSRTRGVVETASWVDERWFPNHEDLARTDGHIDYEPDLYRVGKKAAGRLLDGQLHDAMPARAAG
jgi:protein gp37